MTTLRSRRNKNMFKIPYNYLIIGFFLLVITAFNPLYTLLLGTSAATYFLFKRKRRLLSFVFLILTLLVLSSVTVGINEQFANIINYIMTLIFLSALIYTIFKISSFKRIFNHAQCIDQIDYMNGLEFEEYLGSLFSKLGYHATVTKASGDFGADLILKKGRDKIVVQAKCYGEGKSIGVSAINEVLGGCGYHNANTKIVITNRYFTKAAITQAKRNNVKLIDRDDLIGLINDANKSNKIEFSFI